MLPQYTKFLLYDNCIPVKGLRRSTICDLQMGKYYLIPNDLYDILINYKYFTINEIKNGNGNDEIIDQYFNFLHSNNIIFFDNNIEFFTKVSQRWDEPQSVTNAIIDIDFHSNYSIDLVIDYLEQLSCQHIQVRVYYNIDIEFIEKVMYILQNKIILCVDWFIQFCPKFIENNFSSLKTLIRKYPRISSMVLFGYDKSGVIQESIFGFGFIAGVTDKLTTCGQCGIIDKSLFNINNKCYTESLSYNSCLNKKISIDIFGNIKNCPSMKKSYGKIGDTTLLDVIQRQDFKEVWSINKDKIAVCKDCEFRYICTDCRAYVDNPNDIYSMPLKCGYNPATCEWNDWTQSSIKQNAISYYGTELFTSL